MVKEHKFRLDADHPAAYQIVVQGHLSDGWRDWFDGVTIRLTDSGLTVLVGQGIDQAALHGLIKRVRDLGLPLLSVHRIEPLCLDRSINQEVFRHEEL